MGRLTDADAEALQSEIPPQLAELAETIGKNPKATAVFGSAIVDGDRTVIPVAQARFALGRRRFHRQGRGRGYDGEASGLHRNRQERRAFPKDAAAFDDRWRSACPAARAGDAAL
jgi:hypothetical protein